MKNAHPQKSEMSARLNAPIISKFTGTDNPRHRRAIHALLRRPITREQLDSVAGCSNGPDLIAELHRRGLEIPCERIKFIDRDGHVCRPGVYHLTDKDRKKIYRWLASRQKGSIDYVLAGLIAFAGVCAALLLMVAA